MMNLVRLTAGLLLTVSLGLGVAGCGESDPKNENPNVAAKAFVGTWLDNRDATVGNRNTDETKTRSKLVIKEDGTWELSFTDEKGAAAEADQKASGTWKMNDGLVAVFESTSNTVTKPELAGMVPTALTRMLKAGELPGITKEQVATPTSEGLRWYVRQ